MVFYNGDKEIGDPGLELKVKVLKIAPEKNKELLDTYQVLKEYMLFGERVRLHAKTMAVQEAVHRLSQNASGRGSFRISSPGTERR